MKPYRILVLSASFGAGHVKAAEALILALKIKEPSAHIIHEDYMEICNKIFNRVLKKSYINMIKRVPKLWGNFYQITQNLSSESLFQRFTNGIGHKQLNAYILI